MTIPDPVNLITEKCANYSPLLQADHSSKEKYEIRPGNFVLKMTITSTLIFKLRIDNSTLFDKGKL